MLLFAFRVGRDGAGVLEIHLDLFQWLTQLERLVVTSWFIQNTAILAQNLEDSSWSNEAGERPRLAT